MSSDCIDLTCQVNLQSLAAQWSINKGITAGLWYSDKSQYMLVKQSKLIEKPAKTNNEATQPGHWTTCKAIGDQPGGQLDEKSAWQGPAPSQRGVQLKHCVRSLVCPLRGWKNHIMTSCPHFGEIPSKDDIAEMEGRAVRWMSAVADTIWWLVCPIYIYFW